jgi:hypothetical protein
VGGESQEHATEDVVSSVKKKLGDYLQDVATAIKKDPTLIDKVSQEDHIGPAVKTITTDDGHEIKIHGNEDDGFRISIKNRPSNSKFENLAHAEMACEMFCNRRRQVGRWGAAQGRDGPADPRCHLGRWLGGAGGRFRRSTTRLAHRHGCSGQVECANQKA